MATPEDVPILSTPTSIYFKAVSASLIPPEALIFKWSLTVLRIIFTAVSVAPLLEKPVEISPTTKDSIFSLASSLKDSLSLGLLVFEDVAKKYSQDLGSAINGGDLNYT